MKQGFGDWRIIQPMGEVEFNADAAFIANHDAYKFPGFTHDLQQHGVFVLTLLRLKAG